MVSNNKYLSLLYCLYSLRISFISAPCSDSIFPRLVPSEQLSLKSLCKALPVLTAKGKENTMNHAPALNTTSRKWLTLSHAHLLCYLESHGSDSENHAEVPMSRPGRQICRERLWIFQGGFQSSTLSQRSLQSQFPRCRKRSQVILINSVLWIREGKGMRWYLLNISQVRSLTIISHTHHTTGGHHQFIL